MKAGRRRHSRLTETANAESEVKDGNELGALPDVVPLRGGGAGGCSRGLASARKSRELKIKDPSETGRPEDTRGKGAEARTRRKEGDLEGYPRLPQLGGEEWFSERRKDERERQIKTR